MAARVAVAHTAGFVMGSKYNNLTVRGAERDDIIRLLQEKGHTAFVSPSVNGFTVVWHDYLNSSGWNAETGTYEHYFNVALDLSQELGCTVLQVLNFDDDILTYTLRDKGVEVDAYDSVNEAEYWGPYDDEAEAAAAAQYERRAGDAALLCNTLGAPHRVQELDDLLHNKEFVVEVDRHQQLVELLSLPVYAVGFDLHDIENNDLPDGLIAAQLTRTGSC